MIGTLVALTAATFATATGTDTTVAVRPGARLTLDQFSGSVSIQTWEKDAVRVVAEHGSRVTLEFEHARSTFGVRAVHARGIPTTVEFRLTVPKGMAVAVSGVNTDIAVRGSEGDLRLETVNGEVTVEGGPAGVKASSIEGDVVVRGATGRVDCSSVNGMVRVERATGPVAATTINGDIVLEAIDAGHVEASSINGGVSYRGAIRDGGSYRFNTHNGELSVAIPERASARVSVATFGGNFSTTFPVQLGGHRHGKRLEFTLGRGDALIELESFQGEIRLHRPGDARR